MAETSQDRGGGGEGGGAGACMCMGEWGRQWRNRGWERAFGGVEGNGGGEGTHELEGDGGRVGFPYI